MGGQINGEDIGIKSIKGPGWSDETLKAIKEFVDCLPVTLGDLVTKNLAQILSDSTAFAGADIATIKGYVDCLPATLGDLVTKDLTAILSDSTAFAGADIAAIKGFVDCLPATLGDLVEKNLTAILSDSTAFAGADIATIKGFVDCLPASMGDLVTKNLAAILSDSIAFKGADIPLIKTQTDKIAGKMLFCMDFWSDPQEEVPVGDAVAGATEALPTVTIADLPTNATIVRAIAMFKFRMVENTNAAANKLNGATVANTSQVIQVADDTPGTYYDAINFVDDQFGLAAETREGGDVLIGSIDIAGSGKIDANDGYLFRWLLARADLDYLNFNDVQCGLRIWYSV